MNLVIVESPAKARTIARVLGKGYAVVSSYGHVRDLPKKELGVDTAHDFQPRYVVPPKSRLVVARLKKSAADASAIYFATDEDREGEAIAWHLAELLGAPPDKIRRITFDEITTQAIREAVARPRAIDRRLVDAQQARRILDRLVGYELSPFLWKKVQRGLSAGRVQSAAVRLVVEREHEIEAFRPAEYWTLEADLTTRAGRFTARLHAQEGVPLEKLAIRTAAEAKRMAAEAEKEIWRIAAVDEKVIRRSPPPPLRTSTLQQAANAQLGFRASRTMRVAQQLYEGVDLGAEGPIALITYMRTDSVTLAREAVAAIRAHVAEKLGERFIPPSPRRHLTKTKGAQEAHEAIRPTDVSRTPEKVAGYLTKDLSQLYALIWRQAVASQMADAAFRAMTVDVASGRYVFRATGSRIEFPGHLAVTGTRHLKETILPPVTLGEPCTLAKLRTLPHTTQPPARYSEASLVRALEEHGIGRPSTYAPTIETVQERGYVTLGPDRRFRPTDVGTLVNDILVAHFPAIVDIQFTAKMESSLDDVARGTQEMVPLLHAFYAPFHANLEQKTATLTKRDLTTKTTSQTCPTCGSSLVERFGKRGKFLGCSAYPRCTYTAPLSAEEQEANHAAAGKTCPSCGAPLAVKRSRFGIFLGCSAYPRCRYVERVERRTGVSCPSCHTGELVARSSARGRVFYGCTQYPKCRFTLSGKPTGEKCAACGSLLVERRNGVGCANRDCGSGERATPQAEPSV